MKLVASILASLATTAMAKDWAIIVAGSNGYSNYRHQSDACHAYQIVNEWGIPDERVITFIYDDIANSPENPFPGQMFNKPTEAGTPGTDVYANCKIDYRGADNNPENFIAAITGDSATTGGKPVLKSQAGDRVFINFVDHGGTGSIAFPGMVLLSSAKLNDALVTMYNNKMFSKLVFYMEACESGSMFEGILDPSMGIYATTAANSHESSWGTYCPPDDMVNGKSLNSCLGDLYSVNWMEDCDSVGMEESLEDQFTTVAKLTDKSQVMQFGDQTFLDERIGDFMGDSSSTKAKGEPSDKMKSSSVSSRDIPLHLAYYNYLRADKVAGVSTMAARKAHAAALVQQIESRAQADEFFFNIVGKFVNREAANVISAEREQLVESFLVASPPAPVICGACCDTFESAYRQHCGGYDDYSIQYTRAVVNMCNHVNHQEAAFNVILGDVETLCAAKESPVKVLK